MILAISARKGYEIKQFDVKGAFLNGELKEEIYIDFPKGCKEKVDTGANNCLKLKKGLYGLK